VNRKVSKKVVEADQMINKVVRAMKAIHHQNHKIVKVNQTQTLGQVLVVEVKDRNQEVIVGEAWELDLIETPNLEVEMLCYLLVE